MRASSKWLRLRRSTASNAAFHLRCRGAAPHADAAAAGAALQHHGVAETVRLGDGVRGIREETRAGRQRHRALARQLARHVLEAERTDLLRRRPGESNAGALAFLGELGVLAQKSIARMHGLGAGGGGDLEDALAIEVSAGLFADADGFVRRRDVPRAAVRTRVDGDRRDPHAPQGGGDANGDLAAVGDEDFGDHGCQLSAFSCQLGTMLGEAERSWNLAES